MYIDSPQWYLKGECPCCGNKGQIELITCDNCKNIIAVCDEMQTVFLNPLKIDLENIGEHISLEGCPYCHTKDKFRRAKDFEIQALGLTVNDYE